MSEELQCTHDCSTCSANCSSRTESLLEQQNPFSSIDRVVAVASGKGGVGKSLVTSLLAVLMARKGYKVGILDADITGPSIPKIFGLNKRADASENGIFPLQTVGGIKVMSINLLLEDPTQPVIWRGPVIASVVKQFWTDVLWEDVDFLFIDMPPGTGDVPLTIFQSLPVDGVITVTTPQDLVSMVVGKAVNMAKAMNIPTLGIVENMSFVRCPDCGKEIPVFGKSNLDEVAAQYKLPVLGRLPIDAEFASLCDAGLGDDLDPSALEAAIAALEGLNQF